jgi:hypothetical protein
LLKAHGEKVEIKSIFTTGSELSAAVTVESAVSWDVTSYILVYVYRSFRETCHFRNQGRSVLCSGEEIPLFIRNGGAWAPEPCGFVVTKVMFSHPEI